MTDDLSQTSSEDIENGRFFVEIEIDLLTIPHIPPLLINNEFECRLTGVSSLENLLFLLYFKGNLAIRHKLSSIWVIMIRYEIFLQTSYKVFFRSLLKQPPFRQQG